MKVNNNSLSGVTATQEKTLFNVFNELLTTHDTYIYIYLRLVCGSYIYILYREL